MEIFKLREVLEDRKLQTKIKDLIHAGSVFVYPTDTVYGVGCDAGNPLSVQRIRDMKKTDHPFSVIAPSKKWITEKVHVMHPEYMEELPGPFTLIFRKKDPNFLKMVAPSTTLGVRIPNHPLTWLLQKTGMPIVTTSINESGKPFNVNPDEIRRKFDLDFLIDSGPLEGIPSQVIDLSGDEPRVLRA